MKNLKRATKCQYYSDEGLYPVENYLSTALAHVGLLSSVNSRMYCQSRALDELLATAWMLAHVWPYARVNSFYDNTLAYDQGNREIISAVVPCRAKSLLLAKPFEQVEQAKAFGRLLLPVLVRPPSGVAVCSVA